MFEAAIMFLLKGVLLATLGIFFVALLLTFWMMIQVFRGEFDNTPFPTGRTPSREVTRGP